MTRLSSPFSTDSCNALSKLPSDDNGVSLVLETGELAGLPRVSLAGIGLSADRTSALVLKHRARRLAVSTRRVVSIALEEISRVRDILSEMY